MTLAGKKIHAGVDEAGRGALCGPVVAAAVILKFVPRRTGEWGKIRDSKLLSAGARSRLADFIYSEAAAVSIGQASHREIDRLNIHRATLLAMRRAVEKLEIAPQRILIDGRFTIPDLDFLPLEGGGKEGVVEQKAIVNGDETELAISCASIIAKVYRDGLMAEFARQFPRYGFERHKGYGTRLHLINLKRHGPCEIHRMTYAPVRNFLPLPSGKGEAKRG